MTKLSILLAVELIGLLVLSSTTTEVQAFSPFSVASTDTLLRKRTSSSLRSSPVAEDGDRSNADEISEKDVVSMDGAPVAPLPSTSEEEQPYSLNGMYATEETKTNGYLMSKPYSAFLERKRGRKRNFLFRRSRRDDFSFSDAEDDEDGYADMFRGSRFMTLIKKPIKAVDRFIYRKPKEKGTLILVRHGESEWNKNKTFTGWADPDLTDQGMREVEHAARLLMEGGYRVDVVFTSRLKRAIRSVRIILQEMNEVYLPVFKSWRMNERMYGALTGLSKKETAEQLGAELVQEWRGSLRSRPPEVQLTDPYWPGRDRKYADLTMEQIPRTESLLDCMERTFPLWEKKITNELNNGRNVLVVAHANTLRGLVKTIDDIGDDEIQGRPVEKCISRYCTGVVDRFSSNLLLFHLRRGRNPHRNSNCLQIRQEHEVNSTHKRRANSESNSHEWAISRKAGSFEGSIEARRGMVQGGAWVRFDHGTT